MGKSSAVKVDLDRTLVKGSMTTTILVTADGESLRVTINAEEADQRSVEVTPRALNIGTDEKGTLTMLSHNGFTSYQLLTTEGVSWLTFS